MLRQGLLVSLALTLAVGGLTEWWLGALLGATCVSSLEMAERADATSKAIASARSLLVYESVEHGIFGAPLVAALLTGEGMALSGTLIAYVLILMVKEHGRGRARCSGVRPEVTARRKGGLLNYHKD